GERGLLQLVLGERPLRRQHGHAETEEGGVAVLHRAPPRRRPAAEDALLHALMEALELGIGGGTPARGAGAGRLVDLQVGDRVLAQAVPVAVDEPGRADHGTGLVPGPEAGDETTAQLVAMLLEDACEFHDAGVAGGVVGRLRAGPGVL